MSDRRCSWCGLDEEDAEYGTLVDVEVIIANGEEGFADIVQLLCDRHLSAMQAALLGLGFMDHRHGGVNFLEDDRCHGFADMHACPTPTEYGQVVIGQAWIERTS